MTEHPTPAQLEADRQRLIRTVCAEFGVPADPFINTGYEPAAVRYELETRPATAATSGTRAPQT